MKLLPTLLLIHFLGTNATRYNDPSEVTHFTIGDSVQLNKSLTNVHFTNIAGEIPARTFVKMALITYLQIRPSVTYIEPYAFSGLENLVHLDLSQNDIRYVLKSTFDGVGNLRVLNLFGNDVNYIEAKSFQPLEFLEELNLSHNIDLKVLRNKAFFGLTSLKKLNLKKCGLDSIELEAFYDLNLLISLDLSENNFRTISGYHFSGLPYLQELNLQSNKLTDLDTLTFARSLISLRKINIADNKMKCTTAQRIANEFGHMVHVTFVINNRWACINI